METYIATLFDARNKWYFETTIEANSLEEARRIAYRDYADKTIKVKSVVHL